MLVHSSNQVSIEVVSDLFRQLTDTTLPEKVKDEMVTRYGDPRRAYHNLEHVHEMLCEALLLVHFLEFKPFARRALGWSIVGLDIIYEPERPFGLNKEKSADWTEETMVDLGLPHDMRLITYESIRATARHTMERVPSEARLVASTLCDLDLLWLGQLPDVFDRNTERLWVEASSFTNALERRAFDEGCAAWATTLLRRQKLYQTSWYHEYLTEHAQANLRRLASV